MIIDFDILTILVFAIIFGLLAFFIWKKYHFEAAYFFFFAIFSIYLVGLAKYTLFPLAYIGIERPFNLYSSLNLVPFQNMSWSQNILNMIATIPFGFGLPFVKRIRSVKAMIPWFFVPGFVIEGCQLTSALVSGGFTLRVIDINDIMCNMIGVVIGYGVFLAFAMLVVRLCAEMPKRGGIIGYMYKVCLPMDFIQKRQQK